MTARPGSRAAPAAPGSPRWTCRPLPAR
jgi:hypothetical protein